MQLQGFDSAGSLYVFDTVLLGFVFLSNNSIVSIAASSWGSPQVLAVRDGYLLETLDEMPTPTTRKGKGMQFSGK